jgi:ABC-type sugar transport system, permease component
MKRIIERVMERIIKRPGFSNSKKGRLFDKLLSIIKYDLFGKEAEKGYIFRLLMYLILIDTAFIYVRPILYMFTTMVKDAGSILDPSVIWVPRTLYWGNLQEALRLLKYPTSFSISVTVSLVISGLQVITCAIAGYAFARLEFPLKKVLVPLPDFYFHPSAAGHDSAEHFAVQSIQLARHLLADDHSGDFRARTKGGSVCNHLPPVFFHAPEGTGRSCPPGRRRHLPGVLPGHASDIHLRHHRSLFVFLCLELE